MVIRQGGRLMVMSGKGLAKGREEKEEFSLVEGMIVMRRKRNAV